MPNYSVFSLLALLCIPTGAFLIKQPLASRRSIPSAGFLKGPQRQYASLLHAGDLLGEIKSMRVKELKEELTALGVSTKDAFEKEELVQRLYEARQGTLRSTPAPQNNNGARPSAPPPQSQQPPTPTANNQILVAPLYLTSLEAGTRVAATNGADITVQAKDHPYPSIKIQVTPSNGPDFTLNLLLDTACSGIVLRPAVVKHYNLPQLSTPVTMTGAGGVASNTGLTQLENFKLETHSFGPLPAAVQDIGALPNSLDGIIGLSFLNQFAGAEMDFRRGSLFLFPRGQLPELPAEYEIAAEGDMSLIPKLGIYVVDVYLGGRGPVKMLVDSGASDTFLNWKGVEEDLGLPRDSKFLAKLPSPMGAVGSDAVAMELTHRINISSNLNFGQRLKPGLSLQDNRRLGVDIGNIAILDNLRGDGVGGILGIDAFMRCDTVRMTFQGAPTIQFLLNKNMGANASQQQAQASKNAPTNPSTSNVGRQAATRPTNARARRSSVDPSTTGVGGPSSVNIGMQAASQSTVQPSPNQCTHSTARPRGPAGSSRPKRGDYMNDLIVPVDSGDQVGFS